MLIVVITRPTMALGRVCLPRSRARSVDSTRCNLCPKWPIGWPAPYAGPTVSARTNRARTPAAPGRAARRWWLRRAVRSGTRLDGAGQSRPPACLWWSVSPAPPAACDQTRLDDGSEFARCHPFGRLAPRSRCNTRARHRNGTFYPVSACSWVDSRGARVAWACWYSSTKACNAA